MIRIAASLTCRCFVVGFLAMMSFNSAGAASGTPDARPSFSSDRISAPLTYVGHDAAQMAARPIRWISFVYAGAVLRHASGQIAVRIPSFRLAYPAGWSAHIWPDTRATYGQLYLYSPSGTSIDLAVIPTASLRQGAPALADLIAHDQDALPGAWQDTVTLPLGHAARLSLTMGGTSVQILYLLYGGIVYRFFATGPAQSSDLTILNVIAAGFQVPAPGRGAFQTTIPPRVTFPPPLESCCHCPAWGRGWGNPLTYLDGIAIYWNAGDVDNGCNGTYGTLYQCVELVQRYFALRWGYPPIWSGVGGAVDMATIHPDGIQFIPNGGSPGPQEGDAIVFDGGGYGHVALVKNIDRQLGQIDIVEQNWSPTGESQLTIYPDNMIGFRSDRWETYTIAGWLHSPRNTQ